MESKRLDDTLSVSGQISLDDVIALKQQGIKSIICNRPDNEDPDQIAFDVITKAAEAEGLQCAFIPVSGKASTKNVDNFEKSLKDLPSPIHAYCRSGRRCTVLWALTQQRQGIARDEILEKTTAAGYDLSSRI